MPWAILIFTDAIDSRYARFNRPSKVGFEARNQTLDGISLVGYCRLLFRCLGA